MQTFSLLSLIFSVLFSLFLLSFSSSFSSLQAQTPSSSQHQHHTSQWLIFSGGLRSGGFCCCFFYFIFLAWVTAWVTMVVVVFGVGHYGGCDHCGGCGFLIFIFCYDRCLKEEVGMVEVGCGWVRCLGCWSWLGLVFRSWLGCGRSGLLVVRDCQCLGLARSWRDRRGSLHGWLVLLGFAFQLWH